MEAGIIPGGTLSHCGLPFMFTCKNVDLLIVFLKRVESWVWSIEGGAINIVIGIMISLIFLLLWVHRTCVFIIMVVIIISAISIDVAYQSGHQGCC